jgi:hypothetical protein
MLLAKSGKSQGSGDGVPGDSVLFDLQEDENRMRPFVCADTVTVPGTKVIDLPGRLC